MYWMDVAQVVFTWKEGSGFHGSNQTTLFFHFPLLRCLLRILLDLVWVDFTVALHGRCVFIRNDCVHVCLAASFGGGGAGG